MSKNKFYAVKRGRVPGIYTDINEYMKQVVEFPGHSSKGFKTELEAIQWLSQKQPKKKNGDNSKTKYYVVRIGRVPGIYTDVDEYRKQVDGYTLSVSKVFKDYDQAVGWYNNRKNKKKNKAAKTQTVSPQVEQKVIDAIDKKLKTGHAVAYVDGSFDELSKSYSFGVVIIYENNEYLLSGIRSDAAKAKYCNIAGEMESVMETIRWAKTHNVKELKIVYDCKAIEEIAKDFGKARGTAALAYKKFYESVKDDLTIRFSEVRSHSGNQLNDVADALARKALGKKVKKSLSDYITERTQIAC